MEFAHLLTLGAYWLRETNRRGLGVLLGILSGSVPPGSPNHDPIKFRAKIVLFHTGLKTRPLKSQPVFIPGLQALIKSSLPRLEHKQKNSSHALRIRVFLFPSSFGIETKTTSMHFRSSLENNTRFQTKMCKVYSRFQTKKAQKPYPWDGTYVITWNFRFTLISRYKKKKAKLK